MAGTSGATDLGELSHSCLENDAEVQHINKESEVLVLIQTLGPGLSYPVLESVHL